MPLPQVSDGFFGEGIEATQDGFGCIGFGYNTCGHVTSMQEDFTIEAAYKFKTLGAFRVATWSYVNPVDSEIAWELWIEDQSGDTFLGLYVQPPGESRTLAVSYLAEGESSTSVYNHVAVTYDRAGDAVLYYNGVEVASAAVPFADIEMTPNAASVERVEPGRTTVPAVKFDNLRFNNFLSDPADILDRATNGLPGD